MFKMNKNFSEPIISYDQNHTPFMSGYVNTLPNYRNIGVLGHKLYPHFESPFYSSNTLDISYNERDLDRSTDSIEKGSEFVNNFVNIRDIKELKEMIQAKSELRHIENKNYDNYEKIVSFRPKSLKEFRSSLNLKPEEEKTDTTKIIYQLSKIHANNNRKSAEKKSNEENPHLKTLTLIDFNEMEEND